MQLGKSIRKKWIVVTAVIVLLLSLYYQLDLIIMPFANLNPPELFKGKMLPSDSKFYEPSLYLRPFMLAVAIDAVILAVKGNLQGNATMRRLSLSLQLLIVATMAGVYMVTTNPAYSKVETGSSKGTKLQTHVVEVQ